MTQTVAHADGNAAGPVPGGRLIALTADWL
jgi:hypothetical protein